MAYTDTNSSFTSLAFRQDSDGTTWIKVTALEALTASTPYLCFVGGTGYEAQAVFDTGVTAPMSTTAAYHWCYVGVPAIAISSDAVGWAQIGGQNSSVTLGETTVSAGSAIQWSNATMNSINATYTGAMTEWAVAHTSEDSGSNTAFGLNLVPVRVTGSS
jgi:hypothetical protein